MGVGVGLGVGIGVGVSVALDSVGVVSASFMVSELDSKKFWSLDKN